MKPRPQRIKQVTSAELTQACLGVLRTKFYQGDDASFFKDRKALLRMVVLYPAQWLDSRGVTISAEDYRQAFVKTFLQAAAHVQTKIKYRPAYLAQVIQSHWRIHGEDYYDAAKAMRNVLDQTLNALDSIPRAEPDPIRQLAQARRLLTIGQPRKRVIKPAVKEQFNLL